MVALVSLALCIAFVVMAKPKQHRVLQPFEVERNKASIQRGRCLVNFSNSGMEYLTSGGQYKPCQHPIILSCCIRESVTSQARPVRSSALGYRASVGLRY